MPAKTKFNFSPSIVHQRLMTDSRTALAFPGNGKSLASWQARLRREVARLTGFDRMPRPIRRVPLRLRRRWRRADFRGLGSVEKIVFSAEPGADVPAYACIPHHATPPHTWVICVQGHNTGMHNSLAVDPQTESHLISVAGDRDFAISCMKAGYAALCIEQRSFGERAEKTQKQCIGGCQEATSHALMLGRTLIAERVFDADRAIDYLMTRADVKPGRIGLMGQSGGGTTAIYAGALLRRLAFLMPSCSFCTFRASIMSIGHCADNYVPGLLPVAEAADVLGLFAPLPVVVVAGREDRIFPIAGVRQAFGGLRRIYRAGGAESRCRLVVGPGGHAFYAQPAWATLKRLIG